MFKILYCVHWLTWTKVHYAPTCVLTQFTLANSVLTTVQQEQAEDVIQSPVLADRHIAKAGLKQETGEGGKSG